MACSHASSCPLFPKLNASLESWRTSYCDTESKWKQCARFRDSSAGKPVPIGLLPNGFLAHAIIDADKRKKVAPAAAPEAAPVAESVVKKPSFWARLFRRHPKADTSTEPTTVGVAR